MRNRRRSKIAQQANNDSIYVHPNATGRNQMPHLVDDEAAEPNQGRQQAIARIIVIRRSPAADVNGEQRADDY